VSRSRQPAGCFPLAVAASLAAGVLWLAVTGSVWQFLPIGLAVLVALAARKAVDEPTPRKSR
jgi:hypothetical protein